MKIFDTMQRRKVEFEPIEAGKVRMYVCGPTVYNLIHIGNARPMIVFDTFRRYLEYKGYEVNYVSNFTDVDDKIIKAANEEGVEPSVISERYIAECKRDMSDLNIKPATVHPQATQEIPGMIAMIEKLIENGHAYVASDGTVYFVGHNHYIARMKEDMSGFAEELRLLKETPYDPEPYIEGAFIFKYQGKYHLVQAIWSHRTNDGDTYVEKPGVTSKKTRYSYDCIISVADNVYGPYGERYNAATGAGHNNLFRDRDGNWWATMFFNPRGAQAAEYETTCRPGLIPMIYENGRFAPNHSFDLKK